MDRRTRRIVGRNRQPVPIPLGFGARRTAAMSQTAMPARAPRPASRPGAGHASDPPVPGCPSTLSCRERAVAVEWGGMRCSDAQAALLALVLGAPARRDARAPATAATSRRSS